MHTTHTHPPIHMHIYIHTHKYVCVGGYVYIHIFFIYLFYPHKIVCVYGYTLEAIPKRIVMAMLVEFISSGRNSSIYFHLHFIISLLIIYVTRKEKTFYCTGKRQMAWLRFNL